MSAQLRVLVVHNRYQHRGGEDSVCESEVDLLRQRGHEVSLYERDNADISASSRSRTVIDTIWSSRTVRELNERCVGFRPDIVHFHNTFPLISPSAYHAVSALHVPVIQTLHNFRLSCLQAMFLRDGAICEDCIGRVPWKGVLRGCYRGSKAQSGVLAAMLVTHRLLGTYQTRVTRYIALNEFCRQKFIDSGLPAEKVAVKPNFVDVRLGEAQVRRGGLYVGRLSPEKGISTLAGALRELAGAAHVDVVGSGPSESVLDGCPGLSRIGWESPDGVLARMRGAAYLVMPSIWYENFPRTLVEAFAVGLPVIASRLGALAMLIEDRVTGLLFDPSSEKSLADAILWAEQHPDDMAAMGRNARRVYEEHYSAEANYLRLMEIYNDAVASTRAGGR